VPVPTEAKVDGDRKALQTEAPAVTVTSRQALGWPGRRPSRWAQKGHGEQTQGRPEAASGRSVLVTRRGVALCHADVDGRG
jgi:hypothetical protein